MHDPDSGDVVQAELAVEAAAAAEREAAPREAQRITVRADELKARWSRPSPARATKPSVTSHPPRAGSYVQADVDVWLAHALAAHRGHYAHPAAREAAADLLPQSVLAHVALLSALARLVPVAEPGELTVAARLATAEPEATAHLAALLTCATEPVVAEAAGPAP